MSALVSALNWYHKKIGAYDKQLWEKSVDQRILRGVCAIPRKTTRIKTELIDVDLVQGSAFAKAKPQHSWIVTTLCGIKRIVFLPFYYSWWQLQTNSVVSICLIALYLLQIFAMYMFFTDENELEISVFEVVTPAVMMLVLGIIHSQIVVTFTNKKSQKNLRTKRRRFKNKSIQKPFQFEQDKTSHDSASDFKPYPIEKYESSHIMNNIKNFCLETCDICGSEKECLPVEIKKSIRTGQHVCFQSISEPNASKSESGLSNSDSNHREKSHNDSKKKLKFQGGTTLASPKKRNFSEESRISKDSAFVEEKHVPAGIFDLDPADSLKPNSSRPLLGSQHLSHDSVFQSSLDKDDGNSSSNEDYFVAKKPSFCNKEWRKYVFRLPNTSCARDGSVQKQYCNPDLLHRRYSDVGPAYAKFEDTNIKSLQEHRLSADSILDGRQFQNSFPSRLLRDKQNTRLYHKNKCRKSVYIRNLCRSEMKSMKLSSSCESEDITPPNTPSKVQTSDLEWPIITNTDCNSDSMGCSSESSKDLSDVLPVENPFAYEIKERSRKITSKESSNASKISCTIWQGNECKKADLTALEISSTIIRKVDSSQHNTEYLYIGLFSSMILSFIPLMFRLISGANLNCDLQDVTTDVLTLSVPSSEEVVKITDGLIEVMFGKSLRLKVVVLIVMLERFCLSFAFFFLLTVAEKTFKQRFLYAKHFCYLTSSRGAKRSDLPHFRLNKVKNIKTWLSIRSYMKKLGPQRSVDVIVSMAFILEVCVVSYLCIQLLKETGQFADQIHFWELMYWTVALSIYLFRFMIIGTKINKKYRNLSVLITEQINLYLHMEQKPHKKEELILANNVLKLAADLLKELESPFKISGLCANSYLYNITKVIVLSAFSAMLTDILGFKLKLYKIKIR